MIGRGGERGRRSPAPRAGPAGALLLVLLVGCGGPEAGPRTVSDSVYVEAMARLVLLDTAVSPTLQPALTGAALDSARTRVLRRWGVDDEALLEFARNRGDDPGRMEAIWQRVYELSNTLQGEDWRPGAGPASPDSGPAAPADSPDDSAPRSDTVPGGSEPVGGAGPDAHRGASPTPPPRPVPVTPAPFGGA